MKKAVISFLSSHATTLVSFLLVNLIAIIVISISKDSENAKFLVARIVSFSIYLIVAVLASRGMKLLRWLMGLIIGLWGIYTTILGIFFTEWQQYFIKPFLTVVGVYFTIGGITLFFSREKVTEFLTLLLQATAQKARRS